MERERAETAAAPARRSIELTLPFWFLRKTNL